MSPAWDVTTKTVRIFDPFLLLCKNLHNIDTSNDTRICEQNHKIKPIKAKKSSERTKDIKQK